MKRSQALVQARVCGSRLKSLEGRVLGGLRGEKVNFREVVKSEEIWTIGSRKDVWWRSKRFGGKVFQRKYEGGVSQNSRRSE
jgi:hypothetical protein